MGPFKRAAVTLASFAGVIVVFAVFHLPCPILVITSVPCPTCGMTRAFFAFLQGDFAAYLYRNAMALPVAAAIVCTVFAEAFVRAKPWLYGCASAVLAVNFLYYLGRLCW